jgi:hypothetical protein
LRKACAVHQHPHQERYRPGWSVCLRSKTLDEVYLHPKANQMIEAFDSANQLVKDEVLALSEE